MANFTEKIVTKDPVSTKTSNLTTFTVVVMVTVEPSFVEYFQ